MILTINELRVGNAFTQQGSDFVEFATIQDLVAISEGRKIVEGVPLNNEWLVGLGFKGDNYYSYKKVVQYTQEVLSYPKNESETKELGIHLDNEYGNEYGVQLTCVRKGGGFDLEAIYIQLKNVIYLHELQNLHYALTKAELLCN